MLFLDSELDSYIDNINTLSSDNLTEYLMTFTGFENELGVCKKFLLTKEYDVHLFVKFFDRMGSYLFTKPDIGEKQFTSIRLANRRMFPKPLRNVPFEKWGDIYEEYITYLKGQEDFVDLVSRDDFNKIHRKMRARMEELGKDYEYLAHYLVDPMGH